MVFILLIGVGISGSRSLVLKNRFLHFCPYRLYLLTDVFHIWYEYNLHGILPFDRVRDQCVKVTSAKNRFLHFCPFSLYLLTDIYFIFGWKITCMLFLLWMELGVSWVKVTSAQNRFLYFCTYSLYILTDLFHIWLEDYLHGILPLDEVRG
jgi:hypothetical protein